jgi:hypothetical protein
MFLKSQTKLQYQPAKDTAVHAKMLRNQVAPRLLKRESSVSQETFASLNQSATRNSKMLPKNPRDHHPETKHALHQTLTEVLEVHQMDHVSQFALTKLTHELIKLSFDIKKY